MASDNLEIPITKLQWGLHGAQIFFAFLAMSCIAAVIAFDNKFMSASIISVAHIFIIIVSMFFAAAIVGIPHAYIQYGKLKSLARALRVPRVGFVLTAIWCFLLLIVSVAISIEVGLRNCDPTSKKYQEYNEGNNNETFIDGLAGNCRTERAGTAFGWFALAAWLGSLIVIGFEWRKNRRRPLPGKEEVTMHSNSTTSSLEVSTSATHQSRPQQEQVQMQSVQPEHQTFSPGLHGQPGIPPQQQHQQPHHQQHQQPQDQGPSIHFPQPQHFP